MAELKPKVSNNSSRVTHTFTTHSGNKDTKCVLHPESNHTTAECNKLRNLQGPAKGKGKRPDKHNARNQTRPYDRTHTPKGKGSDRRKGGKGKGKPPTMGSRTPRPDTRVTIARRKGTSPVTATHDKMVIQKSSQNSHDNGGTLTSCRRIPAVRY